MLVVFVAGLDAASEYKGQGASGVGSQMLNVA